MHALLRHLRSQGFECVPEPLAINDGIETLSFLAGESGVDSWAHQHTLEGVRSAATLLRTVHDASQGWQPPDDAVWGIAAMAEVEVICHGDPGPWNMVWDGPRAIGLIDWDFAHPGPALDDVAYALEYFVPFRDDQDALEWHHFPEPPERRSRLGAFVRAYGVADSKGLVDAVIARQEASVDHVRALADSGIQPQRQWVEDGYLDTLAVRVEWSRAHRHLFA